MVPGLRGKMWVEIAAGDQSSGGTPKLATMALLAAMAAGLPLSLIGKAPTGTMRMR